MVRKETLFSAKQLNCDTGSWEDSMAVRQPPGQVALGPGPSPLALLCSAPRWAAVLLATLLGAALVCSAVLWAAQFCASLLWPVQVRFTLPWQENIQSSVFGGKGKCTFRASGELVYINRSPCPSSLISLVLCK